MPTPPTNYEGRPLLDIASYARKGPGRRDRLSPAEAEVISRTISRVPEVIVKVLTRGGQHLGAVRRHLEYLNRKGELELETDDGQRLAGKGVERELLEDWDLDIEEDRRRATLAPRPGRSNPKLVHKVLFSMPPGTPPKKVLEAVKNFAREEFGLKHRYAMVLHTDEPHPHVHMVIKAVSEQGERLSIRKGMLRAWRAEFARHLRALGVPANATERQVRGNSRSSKLDGIYRASLRDESSYVRERAWSAALEERREVVRPEAGHVSLMQTRRDVQRGWHAIADLLDERGDQASAVEVRRFIQHLPTVRTDREWIAERMAAGITRERLSPTR
jgi:hypothetical protein